MLGAGMTVGSPTAFAAKEPTINVKLTSAGCPKKLTAKAGPITFKVTNDGASNVSEFEVLSGSRIVGEVENIAPGLTRSFSLTLKAGTYTTYCPGGDTRDEAKLVVTGTSTAKADPAAEAAVAQYRAYVVDQTTQLVALTQTFVDAVTRGDVAAAKATYGPARVPYERVEPVAETFGDLDPSIDAREGDVPAAKWGGFHKIEQALFVNNTTAGMAPVAAHLVSDVKQLASLVPDVELEPATIANGAVELLNEVSSSKITGEEERYSRIDLLDFQGNVDGAQAAYRAVRPILQSRDAALATKIDQGFTAVDTALGPYRRGATFVLYTELTNTDTMGLAQVIDALAEPLSKVAKKLVASR
jgi:iron uptake system component EfeO